MRYYGIFLAQLVFGLAAVWLLWRTADAVGESLLRGMSRRGQVTAYSAVSLVKRALQAILVIIFVLVVLQAFGIDVTAGLTALGIGGLAIALGAQKLFENLIGSLSLIADRPRAGRRLLPVRRIGGHRRGCRDPLDAGSARSTGPS